MNISGLVEYLVNFVNSNSKSISGYCLEYSCALLMNLCLHKQARETCGHRPKEILSLLMKLLDDEHEFCLPYVNGTLYSLLGNSHINQEARKMQLGKVLKQHVQVEITYKTYHTFVNNRRTMIFISMRAVKTASS